MKPEYGMQNWDIDRSAPRALHVALHKPENNLNTSDIDGSRPQCVKFTTTRTGHNPLNPVYQASKVEYRPPTPPKFIRDQMTVDDIDRARPKKDVHANVRTKEVMKIDDIEGSKPRSRVFNRPRDHSFSTINYNDVSGRLAGSTRTTNPLDPTYTIRDEDNNVC